MDWGQSGASVLSGIASLFSALFNPADPALLDVHTVNRHWNSLEYYSDSTLYGVPDYWATPSETVANGGGDEEDLAIGKLFELVTKGYDEHSLRLVRLDDRLTSRNKFVVTQLKDDKEYVLSEGNNAIMPFDTYLKRYEVIYRLNRHTFDVEDWTKLKPYAGDLAQWRSMLVRMQEDGSLTGPLFPSLPPIRLDGDKTVKVDSSPSNR